MEVDEKIALDESEKLYGMFTPADVFSAFDADFLDDEKCRQWIIDKLHPGNKKCPECGEEILKSLLQSFWEGKRIRCWHCGKYFTALTGTFLSGCHFDFREIFLLADRLAMGEPDKQIAMKVKASAESVRLWRLRFRVLEKVK